MDIQIQADTRSAGRQDFARAEIDIAAVSRAIYGLRPIQLPTQTVIDRKFLGDAPSVLAIKEPAILLFTRIGFRTDVALEQLHITEQECSETRAPAAHSLCTGGIEGKLAGAVLVAGDAQIVSLANVGAEFKRVVALDFSPIVDELDLLFVLDQRTVAAVHAKSVTELEEIVAVVVDEECRHPAGKGLVEVQAGNAGVASRARYRCRSVPHVLDSGRSQNENR